MILRKQGKTLLLIRQSDHARLAAELAGQWKITDFKGHECLEEVLFAVREHDRCWDEADAHPLLDPQEGLPYSFDNYPEEPKTRFYRKGIDEMEMERPYAALLCSKHFASFFKAGSPSAGGAFYRAESERQQRLFRELGIEGKELPEMQFHFRLLQCCDNLSLFICMNEPGSLAHPWFRDGRIPAEGLALPQPFLQVSWENGGLSLDPFPFASSSFSLTVTYRSISLPLGKDFQTRWEEAPEQSETILISRGLTPES